MPSAEVAIETLELLWRNYLTLAENVDLESMDPQIVANHVARKSPVRPFRIAAWLGRQAFFLAAWSLWEHYTSELCDSLPTQVRKAKGDSHVNWVMKNLTPNNLPFTDHEWFGNANCLRNLFAHHGGRAVESRAHNLLQRSRKAFPNIEMYTDGYVAVDHCHVADFELKIENFIEEIAQQDRSTVPTGALRLTPSGPVT
ncbi:MAG: hypothetical protein M0P27_05075 [Bacteroidales bacterium]|nr:hypothetical protein [Bacteroidales bacterium]